MEMSAMNRNFRRSARWFFLGLVWLTSAVAIRSAVGQETGQPVGLFQSGPSQGGQGSGQTVEHACRGTQLNPSILLFHKPHHTGGVRSVRRAAALGCRRVNVVVTLFCKINKQCEVVSYGRLRDGRYVELDEQLRSEFQQSLREVFAEAVAHDMRLTVLAHLNSWGEIDEWRNLFQFDPLIRYGKYNYQQAMVASVLGALSEAVPPTMEVDFSLVGEMGRSVFAHAASYHKLLDELSRRKTLPNLRVGFGFNFDNVTGDYGPTPEDRQQVRTLIGRSDFVGMSHYRRFDLPPEPADFRKSVQVFLQEMQQHGANVPRTMPVHFSEVGIGGGKGGGKLAATPAEAAKMPWEGSDNPRANPWRSETMRKFRVDFHRALLGFLACQPEQNPVTEAFLWSEGSWDPMDMVDTGFADEEIIALIRKHNDKVSDR